MANDQKRAKFFPVNVSSLRAGMLAERALYLYLKENSRYVRFVHAFHPVDEQKLATLIKHGHVVSDSEGIEKVYPLLASTANKIKTLCQDTTKFPFEKNLQIQQQTAWVFHALFSVSANANQKQLPLILIHRAFAKPSERALLEVSEASIQTYERALLHASLSALIAIWLGYSDFAFISQFLETVFKESTKAESGYFERNDGDELSQILVFSKECVENGFKPLALLRLYRIARKLLKIFPENVESKQARKNNAEVAA